MHLTPSIYYETSSDFSGLRLDLDLCTCTVTTHTLFTFFSLESV